MLREKQKTLDRINLVISGLAMFITFYLSHWITNSLYESLHSFNDYIGVVLIFIAIVLLGLLARGVSASSRFLSPYDILKELFLCYLLGALGFGLFTYLFKTPHFSRVYLIGSMLFSYGVVSALSISYSLIYREIRIHGLSHRKILLVGDKLTISDFIFAIRYNKALGLHIIGAVTLDEADEHHVKDCKYLGSIEHFKKILNSEIVDYVIFTTYKQNPAAIEKAIYACQERGIDVWLRPDFMQKIKISQVDYLAGIPLFIFSVNPKDDFKQFAKRAIDIVLSFVLLLALMAPMLIIGFIVRRTTKGPALFLQKRIGLYGRKFIMFKFRTMYTDAQERKFEHKLKNEMEGPVFKMKKDPRITSVGSFLRKYSLDELPQIWNVLIGDMSLVGPRPPLLSEVDLYKGWQRRRLSMRPGITCIWQISGRNKICNFNEWVRLDLKYIDTWSLGLDFKILLKTIPVVISGTGC